MWPLFANRIRTMAIFYLILSHVGLLYLTLAIYLESTCSLFHFFALTFARYKLGTQSHPPNAKQCINGPNSYESSTIVSGGVFNMIGDDRGKRVPAPGNFWSFRTWMVDNQKQVRNVPHCYLLWCHQWVLNGNSPKNAYIFPIDSPVVADNPLGK